MSKQRTTRFGDGRRPGFRSLRVGRGAIALWLVFGLLASASIATAAEIVEVRVGRHPEFTRVVFELDRAAGYRIERSGPDSDVAELVVSLEATTIPRSIQSSKSLIEQVSVEPAGTRSVARIRLAKGGLRLKEMILASPPRIVLDVLSDRPAVASVAKASRPKAAPKAAPAPVEPEESFEAIAAQATPPPAREPAVAVAAVPEPEPEPEATAVVVVERELDRELEGQMAFEDEPSTSIPTEIEVDVVEVEVEGIEIDRGPAVADEFADMRVDDEIDAEMAPPIVPEPMKPAVARTPSPMVVRKKPADEGGSWLTLALVGVGVVVLLAGGLFVARKRSGGREIDFGDEDEDGFEGDATVVSGAEGNADGNPFGSLGSPTDVTDSPLMMDEEDTTIVSIPDDEEKESESVVFADSEETVMDDMEVISRDQVNESLGGEAMPPVMGGIPEEFQQMMREMNRRVEALEGRVDELVDARDRLERQVAAQTEELRVQRAAIARTQRAVRNLARPEDEVGGDEPTEPALRDPNQPSS